MGESEEHIYRCADIIKNDKNISEKTIVIMFLVYKDLILKENERSKQNSLDKTKGRSN